MAKRPETGHRTKFIWLNVQRQFIGQNLLMEINWCEREKPKYEENSIQPKRKFAQFEPEGFSPRAQIEQIFSEAGWNFLNIVVSSEDTSLFTIYNTN